MIVALVSILSGNSGPFTIVWFVVAVFVFSFYAVLAGRARAHVVVEVYERLNPAVADLNPSPAVAMPPRTGVRVRASHSHVNPHAPLWQTAHVVGCSPVFKLLRRQAAARLARSVSQREPVANRSVSAIANTIPSGVAVGIARRARLDNKARVALADFIFEANDFIGRVFSLGHDGPWLETLARVKKYYTMKSNERPDLIETQGRGA